MEFSETVEEITPPETRLKPYMLSGQDPLEGAVLVFASTARVARVIGSKVLLEDEMIEDYIEARVKWLRGTWPYRVINQNLLNEEHVITDVDALTCKYCETWGEINKYGVCETCFDERG